MKLTLYNGSPRGKQSNTNILAAQIIKGFCAQDGNTATVHHLTEKRRQAEHLADFENDEIILIMMPLYCHAMPGIVKEFLEALPSDTRNPSRKLGFIVQSGFQESHQSAFLKAYLDTVPKFIPCDYLGTLVKGGVEGIQAMPPFMTRKTVRLFVALGRSLGRGGRFDKKPASELSRLSKYTKIQLFLYKTLFSKFDDMYWTSQLKKNGCYEKRYDAPYAPQTDNKNA